MKKIISFSLWGNLPIYCKGAIENAKLQKIIYPNWKCRFYIDHTVPLNVISELNNLDSEIYFMVDNKAGFKKLFWRFLVASDKNVESFIVRDCDSRLNVRERHAVKEWEESGKNFHIMRDNKHHGCKIMGGMWGGKANVIPNIEEMSASFCESINSTGNKDFYQADQLFLANVIWDKYVRDNHMGHDDEKRFTGKEELYKVALPNRMFIGQVVDENNIPQPDSRINPLI